MNHSLINYISNRALRTWTVIAISVIPLHPTFAFKSVPAIMLLWELWLWLLMCEMMIMDTMWTTCDKTRCVNSCWYPSSIKLHIFSQKMPSCGYLQNHKAFIMYVYHKYFTSFLLRSTKLYFRFPLKLLCFTRLKPPS